MMDQFKETLNMFRSYIDYKEALTYDQWVALHNRDKQVAALYCQYYDQITLAWYKAKADFVPDEDGVSCVLQYLTKNVPVIEEHEDRYTPAYIYRVAYNCMDCLRFVQRDINRSKTETTNITYYEGEELDLCDLYPHKDISYEERIDKETFWAIIEDMGLEAEKVVNYLLNGESLRRVSKKSKSYGIDPLSEVSVNKVRCEEIIEELRTRLAVFKEIYY